MMVMMKSNLNKFVFGAETLDVLIHDFSSKVPWSRCLALPDHEKIERCIIQQTIIYQYNIQHLSLDHRWHASLTAPTAPP